MTVGEVAAGLPMTRAAVKKHLDVLKAAGLVSAEAKGRTRINRLEPAGLWAVADWMGHFERFWDARLAALGAAVAMEEAMDGRVPADETIIKTLFFAMPPERVWPFLVDREKLGRWLYRAEADLAAGAAFRLMRDDPEGSRPVCWGHVLEMEPPRLLRTSFTVAALDGLDTVVTYRLDPAAGGTRLTLTHEGLGAADGRALIRLMDFDAGWDRHFLRLRDALAG